MRRRVPSNEALMVGTTLGGAEASDSCTATGGDHPTDAEIIAWENAIKREDAAHRELVGDPELLSELAREYAQGASEFQRKIATLDRDYGMMRRTRGDGNCFYRSFVFSMIEHLMLSGDEAERTRYSIG